MHKSQIFVFARQFVPCQNVTFLSIKVLSGVDGVYLLEVVMAEVTEVGGAEAEEDGNGAAVATLVLQEVRTVFRTHLEMRAEEIHYTYSAT